MAFSFSGRFAGALLLVTSLGCSEPFIGDTGIRGFGFDLWDVRCPSGLRVLFEKDTNASIIGVVTVVGAGSAQDPPGQEGLAHLVEHLTFRARHRDAGSVWTQLGSLGATHHNAETSFDSTHYYEYAAKDRLVPLVALESDRFSNPLEGLDDATFVTEREVVRNELRQRNETGFFGQGLNWIQEAVFPADHPYHHGGAGSHGSLSSITLDDARRWVAQHYRPDNMTMLVIGDVPLDGAEAFVKAHLSPVLFGDPRAPAPARAGGLSRLREPPPPVPAVKPGGLQRHQADVLAPEIWIGWAAPGGFGSEGFISTFWSWMAEGSFSDGSFADDPDIASISVDTIDGNDASIMLCRVTLHEGKNPQASADRVMTYLPWIDGDNMYLGRRFLRMKASTMRRSAFDAETIPGRGPKRALFTHFAGHPGYFANVMETIRNIDADAAMAMARRYYRRDQAHLLYIEPLPPENSPPPGLAGLGTGRRDARDDALPLAADAHAHLPRDRRLQGLRTLTLPTGMQVILERRPALPLVSIELGFHGGRLGAPSAALAAASDHAIHVMTEESPSDFGIGFRISQERDSWTQRLQAGVDNLPRALDMLAFSLKSFDVEWPSDHFTASTQPQLQRAQAAPRGRADRRFRQALFGNHPLGQIAAAADIGKQTASDIKAWFQTVRTPGNGALVIVGDIDLGKAEALVVDALGGWKGPSGAGPIAAPVTLKPPAAATATAAATPAARGAFKAVVVEDRPHATQVELHIGCLLPPSDEAGMAAAEMLASMVGSRLNQRVRVDSGASYGVHATAEVVRGGTTALDIESKIDNAHVAAVLVVVQDFLVQRTASGFSDDEVDRARFDLGSNYLLNAQGSIALSHALFTRWNRGWPLESIDRYPDYLAAATTASINGALRACGENLVLSLVGQDAAIRAALVEHEGR